MRIRSRTWLLVLGLLVAGIAITVSVKRPTNAVASGSAQEDAALAHVAPPPKRSTPPVPSAPLPDTAVPVREILPALKDRAARGDPRAACRLAAEYDRCQDLTYRRKAADRWLADRQLALKLLATEELRKQAAAGIAREMEFRMKRVEELGAHCEGVSIPTPVQNIANWRRAAQMGNPAAVKQYAAGNAFDRNHIIQSLQELETYKRDGERLALEQSRKGDVELAMALAEAYDPSPRETRSMLAQVVVPDGAMSLAIYLKIARELSQSTDAALLPLRQSIEARVAELEAQLSETDRARGRDPAYRAVNRWAPAVVNGGTDSLRPGVVRDMPPESCSWNN